VQLKAVIQMMVAAQVNRILYYFTWGDEKLAKDLQLLYTTLTASAITVGSDSFELIFIDLLI
jgi:hypothetical protein